MLSVAAIVAALASSSVASFLSGFGVTSLDDRALMPNIASGCSTTGTASCGNTSSVSNLCCFESPGGLLLQTQFWDTAPSTGPNNSWTIHGLWPDNCDTTFTENCDPSRAYTGIASLLTAQGAASTLSFMQTFWVDINGNDETFWEHEWSTHGTCMSTLKPTCLPSGSTKGAEAVAFFQTVVKLFQTLPTFTWLSNQGITPSSTATHTLASLNAAIKAESGFTPVFECSGSTLNAVQYYFHLRGSVIDGAFQQINAPESGSCPTSGIKYPLKTTGSGGGSTGGGNPPGLPAKATIHASSAGGLLSLGTWSTQTLATYTISGTMDSFTMTSSKGNCGVSSGTFACGSGVSLTSFSAVTSGSSLLLASGGPVFILKAARGTCVIDLQKNTTDHHTLNFLSATMLPSLLSSVLVALGLTSCLVGAQSTQFPLRTASSCPGSDVESCSNSTVVRNLCCFEAPGGLLLQTQFWDTNPATGPSDSWTIHGLWPDFCDLQFAENCDPSRAYKDIGGLLSDQGADDTLNFMNTYWVDINGENEQFWEHEWKTHGTCMSTLKPTCLPEDSPRGAEAVAFFTTVVNLFQTLPTYTWLANQGITPSSSETYTLASLNSALKSESGFYPVLDCQGRNLDSISWYFHLRGSVIDGDFVQIDAPEEGNCPSTGIKYPLKSGEGGNEPGKRKKRPSRRERRTGRTPVRDETEL
ncbi:RNase Gf29 [Mycena venus]|uniref:Ribonuclease T2-like n=1 Tax=Mycena venus TaxID=2733690 RepID=A0A8H7CJ40_9AGAR|nr:RNase Gf29 [Mycena venus]